MITSSHPLPARLPRLRARLRRYEGSNRNVSAPLGSLRDARRDIERLPDPRWAGVGRKC
jgi:hypothetical protein